MVKNGLNDRSYCRQNDVRLEETVLGSSALCLADHSGLCCVYCQVTLLDETKDEARGLCAIVMK